jgi:hypothetical protein
MDESSVQWFFFKDTKYFEKILGLDLGRCIGTEVTTKYGRVDFLYELQDKSMLVIELETGINSNAKLDHATDQVLQYLKLQKQFRNSTVQVALVYASDTTSKKINDKLIKIADANGFLLRPYSIEKVLKKYNRMVEQLTYTSGVTLGRAVALGVTSLSWLNKFISVFLINWDKLDVERPQDILTDLWNKRNGEINRNISQYIEPDVQTIPWDQLKSLFSSSTNFYVLKRLVEDFELVGVKTNIKKRIFVLSELGRRFRDEMLLKFLDINNEAIPVQHTIGDLTVGQKRVLLEILLNGNFTKLKINIFHFLRFVHLTEGSWLPKQRSKLSKAEKQYLNNMFNSSYNSRTLKDLILQTCTFCRELGLVRRIEVTGELFDRVMFTSLGSRVNNHFEQLLHVERERYQIPMQVE